MKKIALLVSAFLMIFSNQSLADSVKIVTLNWGPYIGEKLIDNGIHATIVREAFKRVGKDVDFDFLPWARSYIIALKGKAFLISASSNEERRQIFFYSKPYDNATSYLIVLKKNNYKYDGNLQSLREYNIGVLRKHYLVKMLKDAGVTKIEEVDQDINGLSMLFVERVDFYAMSKIPAIDIIKNKLLVGGNLDQVIFLEPTLKDNPIHLIGHKNMPKSEEIILEFNKGLKQIKEDGTYDSIVKRFGFM